MSCSLTAFSALVCPAYSSSSPPFTRAVRREMFRRTTPFTRLRLLGWLIRGIGVLLTRLSLRFQLRNNRFRIRRRIALLVQLCFVKLVSCDECLFPGLPCDFRELSIGFCNSGMVNSSNRDDLGSTSHQLQVEGMFQGVMHGVRRNTNLSHVI